MVAVHEVISAMPDPRRNLRQRRDRRDFVEADFETHAEECRRFAILNIPRNLFSEASGTAARRSSTRSLKNRLDR